MTNAIDIELLRSLIDYDPVTGVLTWKERPVELFNAGKRSAERSCKLWNARYAGKPALACPDGRGYLHGAIFTKDYSAHRVAWAIHYGAWPSQQIDHINGVRTFNPISNLRDVSGSVNSHNQSKRRDNTSGVTGVHFNRATGKWVASILGNGKMLNLGYYVTIEEAAAVRKAAERRFGFHENHGRLAA